MTSLPGQPDHLTPRGGTELLSLRGEGLDPVDAAQAGTRRGDSNATSVPPEAASENTLRSSPFFRGRKPTNRHESDGSPDATSAVSAAEGPGRTSTARPAATHARSLCEGNR